MVLHRATSPSLALLILGLPLLAQGAARMMLYKEQQERCRPFLPPVATKGQWKVIGGTGQVVQSSHPKLLPIGKGKGWKVSSGAYNPVRKQMVLEVKNHSIALFLRQPLTDGKKISFTATTCGGPPINSLITPGLFFSEGDASFSGSFTKRGKALEGTMLGRSPFYLTDATGFPGLLENNPTMGSATINFTLSLMPGRSNASF